MHVKSTTSRPVPATLQALPSSVGEIAMRVPERRQRRQLFARVDMLVQPFGRILERGDTVSCPLADPNHGDNKEYERGKSEDRAAGRTSCNRPDAPKQKAYRHECKLQGQALGCVSP